MLFSKNKDDIQRFQNMAADRRAIIDNTPATPLPKTYAVNELSKALHPGTVTAEIVEVASVGNGCKKITLKSTAQNGRFPYFRAGQFVALSAKVGDSFITRPYSICSSPNQALQGKLQVTVQKAGLFSNYLTTQAKIGDTIFVGEPSGDFYHDDLRDKPTVFALAGGSGVTPFISMAKSIEEGSENFNLVLVYGAKSQKDLLIDPHQIKSEKVKIHVVLSEENSPEYLHGFITKEVIASLLPKQCSIFVCGPNAMYNFLDEQFKLLNVDLHSVRREHNSVGDREVKNPKTFTLTVKMHDKVVQIPARQNETLLTAMERAGIVSPVKCKSGVCGFCHSRKISGQCYVPEETDHRRKADIKFGYVHPCCTYPESDVAIDVPPMGEIDLCKL